MANFSSNQCDFIDRLRLIIRVAAELSRSAELDNIYLRAVEFVREELGLERCAIFLKHGDTLTGTYGTDLSGRTTDEHHQHFPIVGHWSERLQALETSERWTFVEEMRYDWDGATAHPVGEGWITLTPIGSTQNLIGILCGDAAISGAALDPLAQELVSVFCSLLGSLIERKQAMCALAQERNLLRTLVDNMPDYVYARDEADRFIFGNTALARLAGLDDPEQLIGRTDFDLFPSELAHGYFADDQSVICSGESLLNREERSVDPAGKPVWLQTTKIPLRDRQGNVNGLVGISRNITSLKQAQVALREANEALEARIQERVAELEKTNDALQVEMRERQQVEEALQRERNLLRALIDTVPANVYIKDIHSCFIDANTETAYKVGMKSATDLIGKTDFDFFTPDLAEKYYKDEQTIFETGQPLVNIEEPTFDRRTGQRIWFLTTKAPVRNERGEVVGLVGVGLDITERKAIEEARKQEHNLLRTLIDHLPAEIYIKDTQSRFLNANSAVIHNVGLNAPDELIGKTDFDFTTQENAFQYYQVEQALFASGIPVLNQETVNPDNSVWRLENKIPLRDSQGQIIGLVGFNWDITERKQAEVAQRESERLRLALEKEKELGELKTKLMLTISHEFRTPLSVALTSAELLEKFYERMPVSQRQEHLHRVQLQVKKLTTMLEDISFLIHSRFAQLALNLESVSLRALCQTAIHQIHDFEDGHQRIDLNIEDSLPDLMLDVRRITYVLMNLLSNALKYSDKTTRVEVRLKKVGEGILLQVADKGIGIPEEEQAHIFEPFYRAGNIGNVGGSGLGLSIVKEIVEQHQGTISIQSAVNQGTQISVYLQNP